MGIPGIIIHNHTAPPTILASIVGGATDMQDKSIRQRMNEQEIHDNLSIKSNLIVQAFNKKKTNKKNQQKNSAK